MGIWISNSSWVPIPHITSTYRTQKWVPLPLFLEVNEISQSAHVKNMINFITSCGTILVHIKSKQQNIHQAESLPALVHLYIDGCLPLWSISSSTKPTANWRRQQKLYLHHKTVMDKPLKAIRLSVTGKSKCLILLSQTDRELKHQKRNY